MKVAIVLFNLGAPDQPDAVAPFLRNLFNDPAILRVHSLIRPLLAALIARRRAPEAAKIYAKIGGASPLLAETRKQADALQAGLSNADPDTYGVFVAMRYWHPLIVQTVNEVAKFSPDRVVLVPLYPQFSSTTTASSIDEWNRAVAAAGLSTPTATVCCYPDEPGWIQSQADLLLSTITESARDVTSLRVLFSAHGLPKRVVDDGDPYPSHVESTARAIIDTISQQISSSLDWVVCYQSKVGPLEWIGPSAESEIERAGRDQKSVIIVPISFVSEHSETLVELDITFRTLAERSGVAGFYRVPAVGTYPSFIAGLMSMISGALARGLPLDSASGGRICSVDRTACPCPRLSGVPMDDNTC